MTLRKATTYIIFLGVGVFLFFSLMGMVEDKGEILENMSSAPMSAVAATFTMGLLAVVSRGLRWNLLLAPMGYKANPANAVASVAFGYFANTFIPRSGEVARCAALNSTDDIPVNKLIGTVITERVVDFIMLFSFMTIAFLTNYDAVTSLLGEINLPNGTALVMLTMAAGVMFLGAFVIIKRRKGRGGLSSKIYNFLKGILDGAKSVMAMKNRGAFLAHTLFIWANYYLMSYVLFKSMKGVENIGVFDGLWVMVSGGFGMVFPAPGGIGSYQWAVMLGFESLGYERVIGIAVGNVVWITQTAMLIIAGAIGYIFLFAQRMRKTQG